MEKYIFKDGKISIAKDDMPLTTTSTSTTEVACLVRLEPSNQSLNKANTQEKGNNNEQQK